MYYKLVKIMTNEDFEKYKKLEQQCLNCTHCALSKTRTHVVFGEGQTDAKIMFVGEGPGRNEDLSGKPFVGKAGILLNEMLEESGLSRNDIYITNIIKCRPPGNRDPIPEEQEACIKYLKYQMYLIKPKIVVCLGRIAATRIIDSNLRITKERGQWVERKGYHLMATFHPAAVLRDESKKADVLNDFYSLKNKYDEL